VGIDPQVTPGGRNTAAGPAPPAGTPRSWALRAGDHLHLGGTPAEGKWEQITELPAETLQSAPTLQRGGHGRTDFGPDPVDRRPLIRPNPPLPQFDQQPGRGG
jgi:hypothetical protein